MFLFKQLGADFLNLLFPENCNTCGKQLFHGEKLICTGCIYDLPYTDFHLYDDNPVAKLFWGRIHCSSAMAMLYFKKGTRVQNLIHSLKYKGQTNLGFALGRMLGERLLQSPAAHNAGLIIPVPLHPKRERSRGYNQSKCIADGIAEVLQLPVNTTELIRRKATDTQTKKNRYNRFENMRHVFQLKHPEAVKDKHVLLVDDIVTTGATLESCGQSLLIAGVSKLSIAALAFTG